MALNQEQIWSRAERYKRSFYKFVVDAYPSLGLGEYSDNWHIQLIATALQYLYEGKIESNNLYINVPPGHMKSLLVSVLYPLWIWTKQPSTKFMFLAYAESRSLQDANRRRVLLGSEWYQELFPLALSSTGDNMQRTGNVFGGQFYSSGIAGQITGEHVDYEILDDILNAEDRYSDSAIRKMLDVYDNILPSRFNDTNSGRKVIICQRLSDRDIIGHIESIQEPFERIVLPEFAEGYRYASKFPELNDPRAEGELLWASKFDLPAVQKLQFSMSALDVQGQYQQRPSAIGGNTFKREWFSERMESTDIIWRYLFIDSAASLTGDFTCIMCIELMSDGKIFIRDVYRAQLEFPELMREIKRMAEEWKYNLHAIVIENKSSGQQAIQTLRKSTDDWVSKLIVAYNPKLAKEERAAIQAVWAEKRRVVLPPLRAKFPWLLEFENELFNFPNANNDDQVDSLTMGIEYLSRLIAKGYQALMPKQEATIYGEY